MSDSADKALEVLEKWIHDGLRSLEETWQAEDDGREPPGGATSWNDQRDRIRRETRGVVLYALVAEVVTASDVANVARSLAAQGLSDPLASELQSSGLAELAAEERRHFD